MPKSKSASPSQTPVESSAPNTEHAAESGVAVLDRAFAILAAFDMERPALSLADLANRTGLYKSTILRLTTALIAHGFLLRLADGRFQIGPAPLSLARLYQRGQQLGDIVLPVMRQLVQQFGEGVSFYVQHGDQRICLHRVDGIHAIREHVEAGDVLPLERGSGGRVLLAFNGERGRVYNEIRANYSYISEGERNPDVSGVSAPVFGPGGKLIGALTLAGPGFRVTPPVLKSMRRPVIEAAAQITQRLGGDPIPMLTAAHANVVKLKGVSS
jgi:DNA-binding IclR family transcriptional regulator